MRGRTARRLARLVPAQASRPVRKGGPAPVAVMAAAAALATAAAAAFGGVIAAVLALGYALLGLAAVRRAGAERAVTAARDAALDVISGLAADLRAGAAASVAVAAAKATLSAAAPEPAVRRALDRLAAACEVSETLGAPLADLLDLVESDLRAVERARAAVAAQTAGVRLSAALLALLPVAGVGIGYAMGARPDQALLHTPVGGASALAALLLQGGGLSWTGRLCRAALERAW